MQFKRSIVKRSLLGLCVLAVVTAVPAFSQDIDPAGDWDIEIDMGGTPMAASLTVTKNGENSYSGVLKSPMGNLTLDNVNYVAGESLSFNESIGEGETAIEFKFEGKFTGPDSFEGVLESSMGPMPIKATRAKFESPIAGIWKVVSDSQLGTLERDLVVYKSGKANYVTDEESFEVMDLTVEGNVVTFDVTVDAQGQELPLHFNGTYEGDSLTGEFEMDGSSVAEVTGTKAPAMDVSAIAGPWEIRADTPLGELVATLTFGAGKSTLKTPDGESEVTDLEFDADLIVFAAIVMFEGGEYDVVFEGTQSGDTINGDFLMDGSPVATVAATRLASE